MSDKQDVYVIIYSNGIAENVSSIYKDWFNILHYAEYQWRTRSEPYPQMLMKNGKIIVPHELWNIARNYVLDREDAIEKAVLKIKEKYSEPKEQK